MSARQPGLDTLRAVAILAVIARHTTEMLHWHWPHAMNHGWAGVDLFFVLSGFLIGTQLIRQEQVSFREFYLKRSLRILPCYLVVVLLYFTWDAFREVPAIEPPWRFLLFVTNIDFSGGAFSHAWSLCVEEHFYLVFPLLVAFYPWRPGALFAAVLLGGIALRVALFLNGAPWSAGVYRPSYAHLDGLTVGVGLAMLRELRPASWAKLVSRPWLLMALGALAVAGGLYLYDGPKTMAAFALVFPLVGLGFGAFVAAALAPGFWLARWRIPGATLLATLAYTLYLTHKQMIHLSETLVGEPEAHVAIGALATLLVIGAALALHFGVERPFLALRDRLLYTWRITHRT